MNEYKSCTLNENWFEDRAPPLMRGVLADYGDRCYSTTYVEEFGEIEKNGGKKKTRAWTQLNAEANRSRLGVGSGGGDNFIGGTSGECESYETTYERAFGGVGK